MQHMGHRHVGAGFEGLQGAGERVVEVATEVGAGEIELFERLRRAPL